MNKSTYTALICNLQSKLEAGKLSNEAFNEYKANFDLIFATSEAIRKNCLTKE
jgi:hypothetical protein